MYDITMKNIFLLFVIIVVFISNYQNTDPVKVIELPVTENHTSNPEYRLRIAVMDTGISAFQVDKPYMCKDKTYVTDDGIPSFDRHGHGTNVVGLIGQAIDDSKYCITSYGIHNWKSMSKYLAMLKQISLDNPHAINLSWADEGYNGVEFDLLREYAEDKGVVVIVAAGNVAKNMTEDECNTWPACHAFKIKKNFYVIGSTNKRYTNYGSIVSAYYPGDKQGFPAQTGTSQATANFTGHLFAK